MKKKTKGMLIRLLFILILPVLLANFYLFPYYEKIELQSTPIDNLTSSIHLTKETIQTPSFRNNLRSLFQTPFDFEQYKLCFYNGNHKINYNEDLPLEINYVININNNQTILNIPLYEKDCINYKLEDEYNISLKWEVLFTLVDAEGNNYIGKYMKDGKLALPIMDYLKLENNIYAKPLYGQLFIKQVLFLIAWIGLILLFLTTKKYISKGKL